MLCETTGAENEKSDFALGTRGVINVILVNRNLQDSSQNVVSQRIFRILSIKTVSLSQKKSFSFKINIPELLRNLFFGLRERSELRFQV